MKIRINRRGFTLIELLVVIGIIALLAGIAYPVILNQQAKGNMQEANTNMKQILGAMFDFKSEYGTYPDDDTAETLKEKYELNYGELTGDYSNPYFRQLLLSNKMPAEGNFFCRISNENGATIKPDDEKNNGKALMAKETGFSYILTLEKRSVSGNITNMPIVLVSVLDPGADASSVKFDEGSFNEKGLVGRADQSVTSFDISAGRTWNSKPALFPESRRGDDMSKSHLILPPQMQ